MSESEFTKTIKTHRLVIAFAMTLASGGFAFGIYNSKLVRASEMHEADDRINAVESRVGICEAKQTNTDDQVKQLRAEFHDASEHVDRMLVDILTAVRK